MENKTPKWPAVVVLAVVGLATALVVEKSLRKQAGPAEDPDERRQQILAAFQNPPPQGDDLKQFLAFFDGFGNELRAGNVQALPDRFDFGHMYDAADRTGVMRRHKVPREEFVTGLSRGVVQQLGNPQLNPLQWGRTEIRLVKWLEPGREALVIARHADADSTEWIKMRWWLTWDGGRWRIYDYEDLDAGFRVSALMGTVLSELLGPGGGLGEARAMRDAVNTLREARAALLKEDADGAEQLLKRAAGARLPGPLGAVRHLLQAGLHLQRLQTKEALAELDQAEQLNPEMPVLHMVRSRAYLQLDEPQKALEHARKYLAQLGSDADIYTLMGQASEELGQDAEAADYFRQAVADTPESAEPWDGLHRTATDHGRAEFIRLLSRVKDPSRSFWGFFHEALADKDFDVARTLVDGLRQAQPDSPELPAAEVRLRLKTGTSDDVVGWVKQTLPKTDNAEQRRRLLETFLDEMAEAGKPVEAYRALGEGDAAMAFRTLAAFQLDLDEDDPDGPTPADRLKGLLDAHRQRQPADPWLHYYTGRLHELSSAFDAAEKEYALGMARPLDEQARDQFRAALVYARFKTGRGLSAYRDVGPAERTFRQLVYLFNNPEHVDDLHKLIELHRQAAPGTVVLPLWQAEVHWLRQEYAKAVEQYRAFRPAKTEEKNPFVADAPWGWEERLARALLRLGKPREALQELDRRGLNRPLMARAAATAALGDVAATEKELAELTEHRLEPANFYRDPDLGPLLRTDKFRKLRERYPEPKPDRDPITF